MLSKYGIVFLFIGLILILLVSLIHVLLRISEVAEEERERW